MDTGSVHRLHRLKPRAKSKPGPDLLVTHSKTFGFRSRLCHEMLIVGLRGMPPHRSSTTMEIVSEPTGPASIFSCTMRKPTG